MAITSMDQLNTALDRRVQKLVFGKTASVGSQVAGQPTSFWAVAGQPAAGTRPSVAEVPNHLTVGAFPYVPRTGLSTHIVRAAVVSQTATAYEVHDRLLHSSAAVLTNGVQSYGTALDMNTRLSENNLTARRGKTDYSAVQWWFEVATATGAAVTITGTYTDHLGNTGKAFQSVVNSAAVAANRLLQIFPQPGDNIRAIESWTPSTSVSGALAVVATLQRTEVPVLIANQMNISDWAVLGLPFVYDQSCLFVIANASGTTVNPLYGTITLASG